MWKNNFYGEPIKIEVINQRIYILDQPETAEGTREYLKAEFSFSKEWTGLTKTAFFCGADGKNYSQLLENDTCNVPAEALAVPGRVEVSVSGTLGETIITTNIESFTVPETLSGGTPSDPEPTVWQLSGSIRRRLLGDKRNQIQDSRHKLLAKCRLSGIRKSTKTPYINSPGYCVRERTDAYKQQYVRWL